MDDNSKNSLNPLSDDKEDVFDDVSTDYDNDSPDVTQESTDSNQPKVNLSEWLYKNISILGLQTKRYAKNALYSIIRIIIVPLAYIFELIKALIKSVVKFAGNSFKSIKSEAKAFSLDLKEARKVLSKNKKAEEEEKKNPILILAQFVKIAIKKHASFFKHSANYIIPSAALIALIIVINYWMNLDFALKVTYNDVNIGYIQNEKVFKQAKEILDQRLAIGGQEYNSNIVSDPKYSIALVNLNELSDSNEICEQIIDNSDSGLTTACGVYVDNKFIGCVKNEIDASSVFKSYISDYCKKHNINQSKSEYMVDILEEISYIQGLYSEKTLLDSESLKEYISNQSKSEISKYTVPESNSPYLISVANGLTLDQFYALNPDIEQGNEIKKGTKINIIKSIPFINIKVSHTQTVIKELKYKTVEIKTNALYSGAKRTVTAGKNGEQEVVNLITFVNGVKISEKAISSKVIKQPTNKTVYVGTRPVPSYMSNNGAFVWPVVGARTVTSGFGYRYIFGRSSFHRGVDISGPSASGKPIIASASGTVEGVTRSNSGYGYSVLINHGNGIKTRYAHLLAGSIIVNVGDRVTQGQVIAQLGSTGNSTGPHLHFEIIYNGSYANPMDYLSR